jgi:hypothetical protein
MLTRDRLHRLIDEVPEAELPGALRMVEEFLAARVAGSEELPRVETNGSDDGEPLTPEDEAALEEAYADVAAGRLVSHEEARRRLLGRP